MLSCSCFGIIFIWFGLCQELDGNFIATDGALIEDFGLVQMERKFQMMPTGLNEENPNQ